MTIPPHICVTMASMAIQQFSILRYETSDVFVPFVYSLYFLHPALPSPRPPHIFLSSLLFHPFFFPPFLLSLFPLFLFSFPLLFPFFSFFFLYFSLFSFFFTFCQDFIMAPKCPAGPPGAQGLRQLPSLPIRRSAPAYTHCSYSMDE